MPGIHRKVDNSPNPLFVARKKIVVKLDQPQPSSTPSCRKSARVTQSQNVPVSCFSQPIGQWPAQAA